MNRFAIGVLITSILLGGTSAYAQSAYGPGGLFVHPNALLRSRGDWTGGASWFRQKNAGRSSEWTVLSAAGGVSERLEVGAMLIPERGGGDSSVSGGAFAKYRLPGFSTRGRLGVALAASHVGGPIGLSSVAAVGSWSGVWGNQAAFLHAGLQWAQRTDGPRHRSDVAPFIGLQAPVAPQSRFLVTAEYGTRFSFDRAARSGVGVMWRGPGAEQIALGYVNVGRSASSQFFIGVGYPLGGGRR